MEEIHNSVSKVVLLGTRKIPTVEERFRPVSSFIDGRFPLDHEGQYLWTSPFSKRRELSAPRGEHKMLRLIVAPIACRIAELGAWAPSIWPNNEERFPHSILPRVEA